jgi:hypothetical protein
LCFQFLANIIFFPFCLFLEKKQYLCPVGEGGKKLCRGATFQHQILMNEASLSRNRKVSFFIQNKQKGRKERDLLCSRKLKKPNIAMSGF